MNPRHARPAGQCRSTSSHTGILPGAPPPLHVFRVSSRSRYALSAPSDQHRLIPHLRNACETRAQSLFGARQQRAHRARLMRVFARVRSKPGRRRATAIVARLWVSERPAPFGPARNARRGAFRRARRLAPIPADSRARACSHRRRREFRRSASRPALVPLASPRREPVPALKKRGTARQLAEDIGRNLFRAAASPVIAPACPPCAGSAPGTGRRTRAGADVPAHTGASLIDRDFFAGCTL